MFTKIAAPVVGPIDLVTSRLIIAAAFLAPIFLQRSGIHLSQLGQWIILFSFYIELSNSKIKPILRGTNLILSSLINFYFTIMLLILNSLTYLFILIKKKSLYKKIVV